MALHFGLDLARMYSATTGDSDIVLTTAVAGCKTFANAGVGDSDTINCGVITYDLVTHRPTASQTFVGKYIASGTKVQRVTPLHSTDSDDGNITLTGLSEVYIPYLERDYLVVQEVDGNPYAYPINKIIVSNGTLTDNGDGSVTVTTGGGGGGAISTAKYSGGVSTTTISTGNTGTVALTGREWDDDLLFSLDSDILTVETGGTYQFTVEVFWDKPVAGTPNGVLGVHVLTDEGNHEHWEHFETSDDMASNSIFMTWSDVYYALDTIYVTAENYMGMDIRFNIREISALKIA